MGAIDTIAGVATIGAGPVFTAVTMATGDSTTIRNFPNANPGYMFDAVFAGPAAGALRIRSPRLHDPNTGINIRTSEDPATSLWPDGVLQPLYPSDNLTIELIGTATNVDGFAIMNFYPAASGLDGRLYPWSTIQPMIKNLKAFTTSITNSGTAGVWTDTVITTTENQLQADADYAVLGFSTDTPMIAVAIKGSDTGNVRAGCPATTTTLATSNYFVVASIATGLPLIPVIAANNRNSVYISTIDDTVSTTPQVTCYLAELTSTLAPPHAP